jgi:hypothetical protein
MVRERQQPRQPIRAQTINHGVEARDMLDSISGAPGLEVDKGKNGISIRFAQQISYVTWAKTGGGGIAARSGATMGSGTVTIYKNMLGTLTATSMTVTAYNGSHNAVAATAYIQVVFSDSAWNVFWEDCA